MRSARGFSLLAVLFLVAAMGIGMAVAMEVWSQSALREREAELILAGRDFREAIRRYHDVGRQYPDTLEALLKDPRFPDVRRYLRRIPPDPITGKAEWGLLTLNGCIVGVFSLSERAPLKVAEFEPTESAFAEKTSYSDWRFTHPPELKGAFQMVRYAPGHVR